MIDRRRFGSRVLLIGLCCALTAPAAFAQRGRGGPPSLYENEGFQQEVGLTDEQVEKLRALREESRGGMDREKIGEMFRNAKTDEERQKVREQMEEQFRASREQFEKQSREIFTDTQRERYEQVQLRSRGVSGLIESDEQAKDLGLSEEQREAMQKIRDAEVEKIRETGDWGKFRDPEFREQLQNKMLGELSDEQKAKYEQKLGPEPDYDLSGRGDRGGRGGPGGGADRVFGQQAGAYREFDTAAPEGEVATIDFGRPRRPADDGDAPAETAAVPDDEEPLAEAASPKPSADLITVEEKPGPDEMSFNFRYAPWEPVLREFAEFAGLTLDPGPVPPGTFNYFDDGSYTATEALDVLNGYLLQRGYVLVRRDRFLICANIDEGIPPNLVPDVPLDELDERGENELVRVVLPLERGEAKEAVGEVGPLLGPQGEAAALTATNSVVIRDTGGNVRRVVALLENLGAEVLFEQIPLKHLDAYDAAQTVRTQLGLPPLIANVSAGSGDDRRRGDRGGNQSSETSVTPDDRTNTLLVTADPVQMRVVKSIVEAIDVNQDVLGNALSRGSSRPVFESYKLDTSDAGEVAKTVEAMFPGSVVNEDRRAKTIQIYASPADQEKIGGMIRSIDGSGTATSVSTVIPLARLDPLSTTITLNNMFVADGENAPVVEPDPLGRRLLIRATPDQVSEIKALLLQLGEDGSGERTEGGTLRTLSLGGRDPNRMIPVLQQMWEARDTSPIRIYTPSAPPAVERRGVPTAGGPAGDREPEARRDEARRDEARRDEARRQDPFGDPFGLFGQPNLSLPQEEEPEPAESAGPADAASPDPASAEPAPPAKDAPVTMTVLDGQLVLYSEDQEKLNELEDLVARLGALIPPDEGWNVFYLVNADATLTAETLGKLIPAASVTGTSDDGTMLGTMASGLSGFGGSLMDVAGISSMGGPTSLKIVPDVRANALYVQGPAAGVRQVEQLLTVLDADSRPDNARDRLPRTIPVLHADVTEVADIVREVFKEQTADGMAAQAASRSRGGGRGGGGGGGGDNPLAMLMGGMGGGGDAAAVQLSIGVDTRTSRLIVAAPESLFQQVEALVTDLDTAAQQAERGVQFMTLRDADAGSVTAALSSMMPRVSTGGSVVRSPRSTGSASSGSGGSSSGDSGRSGDDGARDAARMMFMQQMMQNRGGGDRGSRGGDAGGGRGGDDGGGRGGGRTRGSRGGR